MCTATTTTVTAAAAASSSSSTSCPACTAPSTFPAPRTPTPLRGPPFCLRLLLLQTLLLALQSEVVLLSVCPHLDGGAGANVTADGLNVLGAEDLQTLEKAPVLVGSPVAGRALFCIFRAAAAATAHRAADSRCTTTATATAATATDARSNAARCPPKADAASHRAPPTTRRALPLPTVPVGGLEARHLPLRVGQLRFQLLYPALLLNEHRLRCVAGLEKRQLRVARRAPIPVGVDASRRRWRVVRGGTSRHVATRHGDGVVAPARSQRRQRRNRRRRVVAVVMVNRGGGSSGRCRRCRRRVGR